MHAFVFQAFDGEHASGTPEPSAEPSLPVCIGRL
jgi:hypothetical protein